MSVMVILSFCSVLDLKAPAHLDCRLLRRMRKRYWRVNCAYHAWSFQLRSNVYNLLQAVVKLCPLEVKWTNPHVGQN